MLFSRQGLNRWKRKSWWHFSENAFLPPMTKEVIVLVLMAFRLFSILPPLLSSLLKNFLVAMRWNGPFATNGPVKWKIFIGGKLTKCDFTAKNWSVEEKSLGVIWRKLRFCHQSKVLYERSINGISWKLPFCHQESSENEKPNTKKPQALVMPMKALVRLVAKFLALIVASS